MTTKAPKLTAIAGALDPSKTANTKSYAKVRPSPADLYGDQLLIDAASVAAGGTCSVSAFLDAVSKGDAPQPAISEPRFSRWTLGSARDYWAKRVEKAAADSQPAEQMKERAKKASAAAQVARAQKAAAEAPTAEPVETKTLPDSKPTRTGKTKRITASAVAATGQ